MDADENSLRNTRLSFHSSSSQSLSDMAASASSAASARSRWMDFPSFSHSATVHTSVPSGTVDQLLGRDLSAPPAHFTRVLYVPRHDRNVTHLPLYDVSAEYDRAVGGAPMGGSKYKINLSLMARPSGDRPGDQVRYFLDVYGGTEARLRSRLEGMSGEEMTVSLPRRASMTFDIGSPSQGQSPFTVSFPLADQKTPAGTIRFPYFEIRSAGRRLQWQIQPHEHGSLRYTLVDVTDDYDPIVKAIYHHVGAAINLPSTYSEGVVLLSPDEDPHSEDLVVASLLAVLWHGRELHAKKQTRLFKRLLGRL